MTEETYFEKAMMSIAETSDGAFHRDNTFEDTQAALKVAEIKALMLIAQELHELLLVVNQETA